MVALPQLVGSRSQVLKVITATALLGAVVASLIRLRLGLGVQVPLTMAAGVSPLLLVAWVWHWRKWPAVAWVEVIVYVFMIVIAQTVMEVKVTESLLVVPIVGFLHRDRALTVFATALAVVARGYLLMVVPPVGVSAVALQFGAHAVLQVTLAAIYVGLINLAGRAERALVQAHLTEHMAMQWAASIEARDRYTGGHVSRVTEYAMTLVPHVGRLGMDPELFRLACVLHDVGKIAIPDSILNKPGALTPEEFEVMRTHSTAGYDLVLRTNVPQTVADVVRHHHERWDGDGYPDRLAGIAIPRAARILAVVDAFDAMTSDRPYRAGLTPAQAREQLLREAGRQFDPTVVAAVDKVFPLWLEHYAKTR